MKKLDLVQRFVNLKQKEKELSKEITDLKPVFFATMDTLKTDQLEIDGALIYRRESKEYAYPKNILDAEKKLKALKKEFEEKHAPAAVSHCWAVKF